MLRTSLFVSLALLIVSGFTFFTITDPEETPLPPSAIFYAKEGNSDWLVIKDGIQVTAAEVVDRHRAHLGLGIADELVLYRTDVDDIGFTHYRYRQYYKGVKVQGSELLIHEKNGQVETLNGSLTRRLTATVNPAISAEEALDQALLHLPANRYMWENASAEATLRRIMNDPLATYYPEPELVLVDPAFQQEAEQVRLAYSILVHTMEPEARKRLFVDAINGTVFHEIDMMHSQVHNTPGVAETKYHGTREIITDSVGVDSFRLVETTRGRGIETYNIRNGTDTSNAVDFYDDDNYWNNVNPDQDEAATDAFWAAEMFYDYLLQEHNHVGLDGDSMALVSYVHYGSDVTNAFWTGAFANFGDGGSSSTALTALDVVGHEFTHGLTDFTANLIYQNESGALNESFSDIFGTILEFWAHPESGDWEVGEDFLLQPFRNMADPNEFGDPDTYFGDSWFTSTGDNGGVHTNSGVQNYWFYLLTEGAVDTNDFDNPFEVIGLGLDTATQITFRNLKYYLTESSEYADARFGAVQSAADLFGNCSFEMQQTIAAWYAVGVGPRNPIMDINMAAIDGLEPFKCEVSDQEQVSVKLVFSDCDTALQPGTKIPVFYQVDGGTEIWDTVVTANSLIYGDTVYFTFAQPIADLVQPGIYTLTVGADLPDDNTPDNNVQELTLERIYDQNVDLGLPSLPQPLPGCFLGDEPIAVEVGFYGCEMILAGEELDVFYQVDGGPIVQESITVPFDLNRGETFVHTFDQALDLSEIKNHRIDAWASYAPDSLLTNDSLLAQFVVNPVLVSLEDFISFEAGMTSMDSFYYIPGPENRAFLSEEAARDGEYGFQITGGDVVTAYFNNEVILPEVATVWDVNPQFRSRICFCADLEGLIDADFKFRMKQTFSPMYANDFGLNSNLVSAARVTVNGIQESIDFFPIGNTASPYFVHTIKLDDFLDTKSEICIETATLLDVALDPYGVGDNVYIDNVTIVGTPNALFDPLLPETAVSVYPNPGNGQFTLSVRNDNRIDGLIKVTDAIGRVLKTQPLELLPGENKMSLSLDDALPGLYYVQLLSGGKKVVKEVVIF